MPNYLDIARWYKQVAWIHVTSPTPCWEKLLSFINDVHDSLISSQVVFSHDVLFSLHGEENALVVKQNSSYEQNKQSPL